MTDFNGLLNRAQANLMQLAARAIGIVPLETNTWKFAVDQLQPGAELPKIVFDVGQWASKGNIYLYVIRLVTEQVDLSTIRDAFIAAKAKKDGRAYPRLNGQSRCFYVGSSKGMRQRLKDHLGYGAISTYGLHLAHWANHFPLELEFVCAKYRAGCELEVYQLLEDALWDEMAPMFGRKGAK